jgi:fibronectin-binding autotransporter adhesin
MIDFKQLNAKSGVLIAFFFLMFSAGLQAADYYSYQDGDWAISTTWTSDPTGLTQVGAGTPGAADDVFIINGRSVFTTTNRTISSLQINALGFLDLGSTTGHNLGTVIGTGTLVIQSTSFPGGTFTNFVSSAGGTIEYRNVNGTLPSISTYNNLKISSTLAGNFSASLPNPSNPSNYTINGSLEIVSNGIGNVAFLLGNANTNIINLNIENNIDISANATFAAAFFNAIHNLVMKGNFVNSGTVQFSNEIQYLASFNGAINLKFIGANNCLLTANNVTNLYTLEIDKGLDFTNSVSISATNSNHFKLFSDADLLSLVNGAVKIGANINLTKINAGGLFTIPENTSLWVDGGTMLMDGNVGGVLVNGQFRVSSGSFSAGLEGLIMGLNGTLVFEGGVSTMEKIRPDFIAGAHSGTLTISGGTLNVDGSTFGSGSGETPRLCIPYHSQGFYMTGGVLNVSQPEGGNAANGGILIGCQPGNFNVTAGTVNVILTSGGNNFNINSTVPFFNLNVSKTAPGSSKATLGIQNCGVILDQVYFTSPVAAKPLVILNDLNLVTGIGTEFAANDIELRIGRNFSIQPSTTYTPGNNLTTFNGTLTQTLTNDGTITNGFFNISVVKPLNRTLFMSGVTPNYNIRNDLTIVVGTINSSGKVITIQGNINNSGNAAGSGSIQLNGVGNQVISGNGLGIFTNLTLNKVSGTTAMTANMQISGRLRLANSSGILDIQNNTLLINVNGQIYDDITGTSTAGLGVSRMVQTSGNFSAGGLSKRYNAANTSFTYPIGVAGSFTPSTITINGTPTTYGFINIRGIPIEHPVVTATPAALAYYWRTSSTGFNLGAATVTHTYQYDDTQLVLANGDTEADYKAARFSFPTVSWLVGATSDVDEATNTITFSPGTFGGGIDGEYTAGPQASNDPFSNVITFYSIRDGIWNDNNIATTPWSVIGHAGPPTTALPAGNNPVRIGNGVGFLHNVTVTANSQKCGNLIVAQGSVLDIGNTINHSFAVLTGTTVSGNGKLRISSAAPVAVFPSGDFGLFLGPNGGDVEYYSSSINFRIPIQTAAPVILSLQSYNNLIVSPGAGKFIEMPDLNLTILKTFTVSGDLGGEVRLNSASAKVLSINGNMLHKKGDLVFRNNFAQTINANANITIDNGAHWLVFTLGAPVNNQLNVVANLTNNGEIDFNAGGGRVCNITFTGNSDRFFGGSDVSSLMDLNNLTVNKGVNQSKILNVNYSGTLTTPSNAWLNLFNGAIQFSEAYTLTLTNVGATTFNIPATARLIVNNPGATINIGDVINNGADLLLAGKLQINDGLVNIGQSGYPSNNDIEYAVSGFPAIEITGSGNLYVNGQIRRNLGSLNGSLSYVQTGTSKVTIAGVNTSPNRGKLEVLNVGSNFTMSDDASLFLTRGGSIAFADLYLQPSTGNVTGGAVSFLPDDISQNQFYTIESTTPLFKVYVSGTDANDQANLRLFSSPLTVKNALEIQNDFSVLNCNGINLFIEGGFVNSNSDANIGLNVGGFRAGTVNQQTTFSSTIGNQNFSGIAGNLTNFAQLRINNLANGIVQLNPDSKIRIERLLSIENGTLLDNGNEIIVIGNIFNGSIHQSVFPGKISCEGIGAQVISGNGSGRFGFFSVNNPFGVFSTTAFSVENELNLASGNLVIDYHMVLIAENAAITGVFGPANMVRTAGTLSDSGLAKVFPAGATSFLFPVGTGVNYTPVDYNILANAAQGTIRVAPVPVKHPATTLAADEELNYHWRVRSTGFSGLNITHVYNYLQPFVSGTETNYVTGRYVLPQWIPTLGIPGTVDAINNTMTLTGVNFIDGDYTCGDPLEFDQIDTLYSRNATLGGAWDGINTWSTVGHAGPPSSIVPTFQILKIAPGHTVNTNGDGRTCSVISIDGVLDTEDNQLIVFGFGDGIGRLRVRATSGSSFLFPQGDLTLFNSALGGTVEYYGSSNGIVTGTNFYNNVEYVGTSIKTLGSNTITVFGDMKILAGVLKNDVFNSTINLRGDFENNSSPTSFLGGSSFFNFNGGNQTLGGLFNTSFGNLSFEGTGTKLIDKAIVINENLTIDAGVTVDVTVANNSIVLKKNWTNDGIFLAQAGTLNLTGETPQLINGASVSKFHNINLSNVAGVQLGNNAELENSLEITSGTFTSTGFNLTLLSNASLTGRIGALTVGNFIGNIVQQRLAPGPLTGWAMLGVPVQGGTITQWTDDFPTSGFIGSTGYIGGFISIYTYDELDQGAFGSLASYIPITNASLDPITPGKGYWVYLGTGFVNTADILIEAQGPIVKGNFNFAPTFTSSGNLFDDGWNLIANPYPSSIDWDSPSWTKTNMDDAIYIYQADLQQYATYIGGVSSNGGSNIIGSSQGFFVKANGALPILSISENAKSSSNSSFLRSVPRQNSGRIMTISVEGNNFKDESLVRIHENASTNFDSSLDGFKIYSNNPQVPSIATISNGVDFSINSLPSSTTNFSIPVKVKVGVSGTYELKLSGIDALASQGCVVLEDKVLGTQTQLNEGTVYSFNMDAAYSSIRFVIHVAAPTLVNTKNSTCTSEADGSILIEGTGNGTTLNYVVLNHNGNSVAEGVVNNGGAIVSGLDNGTYTVNFSNANCNNMTVVAQVNSNSAFALDLSTLDQVLVAGKKITLNANAPANAEVVWTLSNGTVLRGHEVQHIFTETGAVQLTVKVSDGECITIEEKTLNVGSGSNFINGAEVIRDQNGYWAVINLKESANVKIELLNAAGQLLNPIMEDNISSSKIQIPTEGLSSGIYLIKLTVGSEVTLKKIQW